MRARSLILSFCLFFAVASHAQQPAPAAPADPYEEAIANLKHEDAGMRRRAADQLGQMRRREAVTSLLPLINDPNILVRQTAIDSVGLLRGPAGPLIEKLKKDKEGGVRQSAAAALAYIADPSAADALIAALDDPEMGVRYAAMRTLGIMRIPAAAAPLAKALKSADAGTRATAAASLGQIQSQAGVAALQEMMSSEKDPAIRAQAVKSLGNVADASSAEKFKEALKDPQPEVRVEAALGLGRTGDLSGVPVVCEVLKNPAPALRVQAANVLGMIGDKEKALAALREAFFLENDPGAKKAIDYAKVQLKARFGIKEPEPEAPAAPKSKDAKPAISPKTAPSAPKKAAPAPAPAKKAPPKKKAGPAPARKP